ncbi:MAG: SurA N-terminal domain-containing protein [Oligoflexia bacterium]|nr:SurA N-terminal domain-containing protein [Oligoflexia bacterium]
MFSFIREKFGTVVIGGIIGFIAFVFVFSGVFSPKATRGLHEGAVAGKVNGDSITLGEFNRALNQRIEYFKNMTGGKLTDDQIRAFRLRDMVFQDLVRRKLLVQEAGAQGMSASDEQVRESIREIPAFQKEGKFDLATYKRVLQQNQYTPGGFERMVREDMSAQQWESYFGRRVFVSDEEARTEFSLSQDKRKLKYVLLSTEAAKKAVPVAAADVQKFLSDAAKLGLAKSQYEARKGTTYKDKSFDQVKETIARELLGGEKLEEARKLSDKTAEQLKTVLAAGAASDAKVAAILKAAGYHDVSVKTTEWITRESGFIPGLGESASLMRDAFAPKSPIDAGQGGKAGKYELGVGIVVALVTETQKPDLSKFGAERDQVVRRIASRKQRDLYQGWMDTLMKKAKIDPNPSVVGEEG